MTLLPHAVSCIQNQKNPDMNVRINKYLAERGVCSRRRADTLIDERKVTVNGQIAEKGMIVSGKEEIFVNGKKIFSARPHLQYLAFHKPVGIMTSVDPMGHDTIATFLRLKERLFPIGRLDVASSGLLILTNDGNLSEAITHPRGNHQKEYVVTVDKPITDEDLRTIERGMTILGSKTKPADTKRIASNQFHLILKEGRNRQIRRMCEKLGYEVNALSRIRVMNIHLGTLAVGHTRPLTQQEISELKRAL